VGVVTLVVEAVLVVLERGQGFLLPQELLIRLLLVPVVLVKIHQ
jgi:hypothetical protein